MGYRSRSEQLTKTSEINLDYQEVVRWASCWSCDPCIVDDRILTYKRKEKDGGDDDSVHVCVTGIRNVSTSLIKSAKGSSQLWMFSKSWRWVNIWIWMFGLVHCLLTLLLSLSFQNINVHIDENSLHEILNEVDLNKNGQVEIDEFLQVRNSIMRTDVFTFLKARASFFRCGVIWVIIRNIHHQHVQ